MASALRYVTLDRQRWGMPMMQGNHLMLFYNKALVSTPVTYWQQLTAITPALKAKGSTPSAGPITTCTTSPPFYTPLAARR